MTFDWGTLKGEKPLLTLVDEAIPVGQVIVSRKRAGNKVIEGCLGECNYTVEGTRT